MAVMNIRRLMVWLTFNSCLFLSVASPTRRQFVTITEATSSDPSAVLKKDEAVWDDTDDFDLDGEGWLSEDTVPSSSIPQHSDYEDYDDDDDYAGLHHGNIRMDFADDEEVVEQPAEEEDSAHEGHDSEFLFLPPRDTRLMLEDDDDINAGPIKVRHTSKGSYSKVLDQDNTAESSDDGKDDVGDQFEFTVEDDHEDKEKAADGKDDFVLDDPQQQGDASMEVLPRQEFHSDDDDDEFVADADTNGGNAMFESPEEEAAQVIYGDHVFLY